MDVGLLALHVYPGCALHGPRRPKLFGVFGGHGIQGTGGFFEALGLRPDDCTVLSGSAEFFGGLLLALGLFVRSPRRF